MSSTGNPAFLFPTLFRICLPFLLAALCATTGFSATLLDPTFGSGGKVTLEFPDSTTGYQSFGHRIFVQPGGRIVAAGTFTNQGPDGYAPGVAMAGLMPGGALDPAFGSAGTLRIWDPVAFRSLGDVFMYPDGKILRISQYFPIFSFPNAEVVRINADGSNDKTFSASINIGNTNTIPQKMSVRSDGKIVTVVFAQTSPESRHLFRLNPDGSRDTTFGAGGDLLMNFGRMPNPIFIRLLTLPDGKILLAGHLGPFRQNQDYNEFFIAKFTSDGFFDRSFGNQGLVRFAFPGGLKGFASNMLAQPDGKLLITGGIQNPDMDTLLIRLTARGKPDQFFGNAGVVISDFTPGGTDSASAARLSSDGRIRIAGLAGAAGAPSDFLLARYSSAGILEDQVMTAFTAGQNSAAADVTIQPDGKILLIGFTRNPNPSVNGNVFAIARYTE